MKILEKRQQLLLILLTILVFFPNFFNDFQLAWDDQWQLLDFEFVVNHSYNAMIYHFTNFYQGQYFPVNTVLYILLYESFGFNASVYHAACLLIHVFNALLVYGIIVNVLAFVKRNWTIARIRWFSFMVALIFAVHPLQVESVAWISASKIVLYTLFTLLAIRFYISYIKSGKKILLLVVALCYLLSFGSKEQAIILPLNLIAFDYIFNRYRNVKVRLREFYSTVLLEKLFFLLIGFFMYRFSVANNLGTFDVETYPLYQRLLFGMSSFMEYIFRFIAPVKLYYFYFFPIEIGENLPAYYWGYPVLILICVFFVLSQYERGNRLVLFGIMLFVINLLLVLHIVPMPRKMITADRYMYVSIVGIGIVLTWLIQWVYLKKKHWRKIVITLCCGWMIFLGVHSHERTKDWQDSDSIKQNVTDLIERRKAQDKPVVNNPLKGGLHEEK
ncbi:hypothetical protein EYV94_16480 [Puteibacter caeruleilacunae]|nr:hypothetical protein EYV94_16480 [Puteibacter caeruleilacunae]